MAHHLKLRRIGTGLPPLSRLPAILRYPYPWSNGLQLPRHWRLSLMIGLICIQGSLPLRAQQNLRNVVDAFIYRDQSAEVFRSNLEKRARLPLQRLQQNLQLEPSQIEKLNWAIEGDLTRLNREIDRLYEKAANIIWLNNAAWVEHGWAMCQPLYNRIHGGPLLDDNSLYQQMIDRVLTEPQRQQFNAAETERLQHRNRTLYRMSIWELSQRAPLTQVQREKLLQLMLDAPQPKGSHNDLFVSALGYIVLSKVAEADLRQLFDEAQLKVIYQLRDQHAGQVGFFEW